MMTLSVFESLMLEDLLGDWIKVLIIFIDKLANNVQS